MLHEIGHIALNHANIIPDFQKNKQEYEADDFATKWVMNNAGHGLILEYRIMAVCTAIAYLLLNQRIKGTGATHPPAIHRIRPIIEEFTSGERSVGLESAAYFLKAIFDPETHPPEMSNAKELFDWVIETIISIFKKNN